MVYGIFYEVQLLLITFFTTHSRIGHPIEFFSRSWPITEAYAVCWSWHSECAASATCVCIERFRFTSHRSGTITCEREWSTYYVPFEVSHRKINCMGILVALLRRPAASMGVTWWTIDFHICEKRFEIRYKSRSCDITIQMAFIQSKGFSLIWQYFF